MTKVEEKKKFNASSVVANLVKQYQDKDISIETGKLECEFVDTGNMALNYIMSGDFYGGIPKGHGVTVAGDPSSGKSLLLCNCIAHFQAKFPDGVVILDDTEKSYVKYINNRIPIDEMRLMRVSTNTVEEHYSLVFDEMETKGSGPQAKRVKKDSLITLLDKEGVKDIMIVVDSMAAWSTEHETAVGLDKPNMDKAKVLKAFFRLVKEPQAKYKITYIVSNHLIMNIGDMFGPKKVESGGSGAPFAVSIRLQLEIVGKIKAKDDVNDILGVKVRAQALKNRFAPPFKKAEFEIRFDGGIDKFSGMIEILLDLGIIELAPGGWYQVVGHDIKFQSKDLESKWPEIEKIINSKKLPPVPPVNRQLKEGDVPAKPKGL